MSREVEPQNRLMLRARDAMDRQYGIDAGTRDPFGNKLRFVRLAS